MLGVPRGRLALLDELPAPAAATFAEHVARRAAREPLQHITGRAPFRQLVLAVGPGVFVPRPETELLVDAVLPHLRALDVASRGRSVLGIGRARPRARRRGPRRAVIAVELAAAGRSAGCAATPPGPQVWVVPGDVRDAGLLGELHGRVDAVVSNPPYVPLAADVAPEVRADPAEAVFAGADGLGVIPDVLARAADLLRPGGVFAVEHDETQQTAVAALLRADGRWADVAAHRDLAGRPRYATATRR